MNLQIRPEVQTALAQGRPVVALESTIITHGLPRPLNHETALEAEEAIRSGGGTPATIAILKGVPTIGISEEEVRILALSYGVLKASTRDLGSAVAQKRTAATTVAATMRLAHRAGIRVFATGGIGGVHRGVEDTGDVSADLMELARTPVAVVCAGAKNILDLPRTLEYLETLGVPVIGYNTGTFPAFYVRSSGLPVATRVDTFAEAAQLLDAHWELGGCGVLLTQPVAEDVALSEEECESAVSVAEHEAQRMRIQGAKVTPFLLQRLAELTHGKSLRANRSLLVANARLATQVAASLKNKRFFQDNASLPPS